MTDKNHFAIADCDDQGALLKSYCVIQVADFFDKEEHTSKLAICSCNAATQQRLRLKGTKKEIVSETLDNFTKKEEDLYCIHCKVFVEMQNSAIFPAYEEEKVLSDSEEIEYDEVIVDQLRAEPLLAAVFMDGQYAIVSKSTRPLNPQNLLECLNCNSNKHKCKHVSDYIDWAVDNSLPIQDLKITEEPKNTNPSQEEFRSISTKAIPYPLTDKLKAKYDCIESGEYCWADVLAPELSQTLPTWK